MAKTGEEQDAAHTASVGGGNASGPRSGSSSQRADTFRHSSGMSDQAYGALDLGTNNCRLLVARPSRRGFLVVDAFSRIIRLGEGVGATGRLSDVAMNRTLEALKICAAKLRRARVVRSRLVATDRKSVV